MQASRVTAPACATAHARTHNAQRTTHNASCSVPTKGRRPFGDQFFFFVVLFFAVLDFEGEDFADDLLPDDLAVVPRLPDFAVA
ncbi:hypothetical protein PAN31108_01612 [Pandoraea anhela]|uniref:Uncharacterized protein n=1 Tax=Pandoraea anhela TaxID=2508295 RepID=A0A5E4TUQ2_9BURK|nr:hypothetical protein PAN31108_01612 [Pandoraea anhela]